MLYNLVGFYMAFAIVYILVDKLPSISLLLPQSSFKPLCSLHFYTACVLLSLTQDMHFSSHGTLFILWPLQILQFKYRNIKIQSYDSLMRKNTWCLLFWVQVTPFSIIFPLLFFFFFWKFHNFIFFAANQIPLCKHATFSLSSH